MRTRNLSSNPQGLCARNGYLPLIDVGSEAPRTGVAFLSSHSQQVAELGLEPSLDTRTGALKTWVCRVPLLCVHAKSLQSRPTLCDPVDWSLSGSSLYGILQAGILEWAAISFSRGSSRPRVRTLLSCLLPWQAGSLPTSQVLRSLGSNSGMANTMSGRKCSDTRSGVHQRLLE